MKRWLACAILVCASRANADKAAADAAFAAGKKLMAAGKPAEACPKFELSYKEDPQLGSLLNLADCHEQIGKLATAWAEFRAAAEVAQTHGDKRADFARDRAAKLDARISFLTVHKTGDATIELDGRDVTALAEIEMPIDPGEHTLEAGGRTQTVKVDKEGSHLVATVAAPEPTKPAPPPPPHPSDDKPVPAKTDTPSKTETPPKTDTPVETAHEGYHVTQPPPVPSHRKRNALIVGGVGVVAAGVGLYFGKTAFDDWDQSHQYCDANNACQQPGKDLIDSAKTAALESDIFVGAGVVGLVVGTVLFVTAPKEVPKLAVTPLVGPHLAGAGLHVSF